MERCDERAKLVLRDVLQLIEEKDQRGIGSSSRRPRALPWCFDDSGCGACPAARGYQHTSARHMGTRDEGGWAWAVLRGPQHLSDPCD